MLRKKSSDPKSSTALTLNADGNYVDLLRTSITASGPDANRRIEHASRPLPPIRVSAHSPATIASTSLPLPPLWHVFVEPPTRSSLPLPPQRSSSLIARHPSDDVRFAGHPPQSASSNHRGHRRCASSPLTSKRSLTYSSSALIAIYYADVCLQIVKAPIEHDREGDVHGTEHRFSGPPLPRPSRQRPPRIGGAGASPCSISIRLASTPLGSPVSSKRPMRCRDVADNQVLDAAIVGSAQAVEHYDRLPLIAAP